MTLPFTNRPARFPLTSQLPQLRTLKLMAALTPAFRLNRQVCAS